MASTLLEEKGLCNTLHTICSTNLHQFEGGGGPSVCKNLLLLLLSSSVQGSLWTDWV